MSAIVLAFILSSILLVIIRICRPLQDDLSSLPGPAYESWLYGVLPQLLLSKSYGQYEFTWLKDYGKVYRLQGCLGESRLMVADPVALRFIFQNMGIFRPENVQRAGSWALSGIHSLFVRAEQPHRAARNVMNPAFAASYLKELVPMMQGVARKLSDCWESKLSSASESANAGELDIYKNVQQASLEAVAECVLGHSFNSIGNDDNELANRHFNLLIEVAARSEGPLVAARIMSFIPFDILKRIVRWGSTPVYDFNKEALHFAREIYQSKVKAVEMGLENSDLLSVIISENSKLDSTTRLKDEELIQQIPDLLVAGQDTTGNTLTWALYEFAKNQEWQEKVRGEINELRARTGGSYSYADFETLTSLNAHLKETLRFHPGLPLNTRVALEDAVIPLAEPVKTKDGRSLSEMPVRKGQVIQCALASYNRIEEIWGADANTFNPLRWLGNNQRISTGKSHAFGPYANLATFIGGPRTCIGWRFSLLDMQITLVEILPRFRFELIDGAEVRPRVLPTLLPVGEDGEPQMSLRLTLLQE